MCYTNRMLGALLLGSLVVGTAWAQDRDRPTIFQSHDVIGKNVKNADGETIGNIEDYVVNKDGKIVYIAVAVGETAGFGGRLYAVPPDGLKLEPNGQHFMINAKKADFDADKGFDANKWPTRADMRWGKNGKRDAESRDDAKDNEKDQVFRVSKLKGMTVKNARGETLGRIYEVVLNLDDSRVGYMAFSYGGVLGVGAKLYAIPFESFEMKSLTLNPADRTLVLNNTKQDFETTAGFDNNAWPAKADDRWKRREK
jgi:sporulation protein YlmC with PRC-barrel domain